MINQKLNQDINDQISREFNRSARYENMAAFFAKRNLHGLAEFFHKQAEKENASAMQFVNYVLEADGRVEIPLIKRTQYVVRHQKKQFMPQ